MTDRTFTYDAAGKLLTATETEDNYGTCVYTFEYDLMGNRTYMEKTLNGTVVEWHRYEYNESNQLISEKLYNGKKTTSLAYNYDADGNRISETGRIGTDKVNRTYEYSVENRLAAVHDGDELLLAAAYDGDGNRVFLLNYNLHTDDDWKGNSGNGNGNNKDNSGSGNKGNGESGLLNNRAGQIFLDYGDIVMGPAVKTPADIIVIRETVKGNSDSKEMQRTATAGFYAGFVGQGIEYTQIISNADYQLSMIITSAKGVNSINNPLSYLLFIKDFSLTQTIDAAKAGLQDAWNGTYDSAIGRKIGAGTFNYLLMTIGGAQLKGKGTACEAVESGRNTATTINYSYKFDRELANFNDGYEIRTTVDKDLILVQYSSDAPDASLCYWTTVDEANRITTLNDYMDKLALSKDWGNRNTVKVARIPAGIEVKYAVGTAREQLLIADPRPGGGVQYLFNQFDTDWITEIRSFSN